MLLHSSSLENEVGEGLWEVPGAYFGAFPLVVVISVVHSSHESLVVHDSLRTGNISLRPVSLQTLHHFCDKWLAVGGHDGDHFVVQPQCSHHPIPLDTLRSSPKLVNKHTQLKHQVYYFCYTCLGHVVLFLLSLSPSTSRPAGNSLLVWRAVPQAYKPLSRRVLRREEVKKLSK